MRAKARRIVLVLTGDSAKMPPPANDAGGGSYSDVKGAIFALFRPARQPHRQNRA